MRLCMFHPSEHPMDRGWVGRVDEDGGRMVHLAAQTLQSLFLNGTVARDHAEYPLDSVTLLVPVQYPPTVRVFDEAGGFAFANATAVVGDGVPVEGTGLRAVARVAAVIGAAGAVGGWSALVQWEDTAAVPAAKRSDFGLVLGPTVVTPDEADPSGLTLRLSGDGDEAVSDPPAFAWADALALAGRRTMLRPGDVVAGPPVVALDGVVTGVELDAGIVGTLRCPLA